jgi:Iap family predicted aminopeptidase
MRAYATTGRDTRSCPSNAATDTDTINRLILKNEKYSISFSQIRKKLQNSRI